MMLPNVFLAVKAQLENVNFLFKIAKLLTYSPAVNSCFSVHIASLMWLASSVGSLYNQGLGIAKLAYWNVYLPSAFTDQISRGNFVYPSCSKKKRLWTLSVLH